MSRAVFYRTCYDGMKVFKTFQQLGTDTLHMNDKFGSLVYQIKRSIQ